MEQLRALEPGDIPQLVRLRRSVYKHSAHDNDESLARYYRTLFFENPWFDARYPSYIFDGGEGEAVGFIGAIPRPMLLGAERLTAVTATELMVAPDARGFVGVQLLRRLFDGGQAFTYSDRGNDIARGLFEGLGGSAALWYSLYWTASLDGSPLRFSAPGDAPGNFAMRALGAFGRRLDLMASRRATSAHITTTDEPLKLATAVDITRRMAAKNTLVPEYDEKSFHWLLQRLTETRSSDRVVSAQIMHEGEAIGFFIYVVKPDSEIDLVQLTALPRREALAFDHLLHHAVGENGTVLRGRLDRRLAPLISEREFPLTLGQPWTLVRSSRADVASQFLNGNALLGRFDAEWWIGT